MKEWRGTLIIAVIVIAGFIGLGAYLGREVKNIKLGGAPAGTLKKLASELESRGLWQGAADTYTRYLNAAGLPQTELASVSYHLGSLYLDHLSDPERALPFLIMAKQISGDGGVGPDADKRIVEAFEKLGRSQDAQTYLREASSLESTPESRPNEVVLAKIGDREITLRQLNDDLQMLPDELQKQINTPDKKFEFLQGLIVKELMLEAARRQGIDKDPEVARIAQNSVDAAILQLYQDREIDRKINITEADVRGYYDAHKDEFVRKDEKGKEIKLRYEEAKDEARARLMNERRRSMIDDLINRLQQAEKVEVYRDRIPAQ